MASIKIIVQILQANKNIIQAKKKKTQLKQSTHNRLLLRSYTMTWNVNFKIPRRLIVTRC